MVVSETLLLKGSAMKIWTALIMIVAVAMVVVVFAAIGAIAGMLIAFLLGTSVSSAAPVGALSGGFAAFVFLMNAKENGGKGLQ